MEENDSTKPVFDFFDFQPKTCSFSIIGIGGRSRKNCGKNAEI